MTDTLTRQILACAVCGGTFAVARQGHVVGHPLQARDVQHTDGRAMVVGEAMRCDSCGQDWLPPLIREAEALLWS